MDVSTITEMKELKAIAYDTLQLIERQQNNLRILQQRIAELEQNPIPEPQPLPIPEPGNEKKK